MTSDEIKAKIFGLNAAVPYGVDPIEMAGRFREDRFAKLKTEYQENPQPSFATYGPKTRREFLNFLRAHGDRPA